MCAIKIYEQNSVLKKLFFGFKHIRFKSFDSLSKKSSYQQSLNLYTAKLSELLDCSNLTARKIIMKNNYILRMAQEDFIRNATFCHKHFKFSELIEFPLIISINSSLLQHRYHSLHELGCYDITASGILRFPQLIKKSPKVAKSEGHFKFHCQLDYYLDILGNAENKVDVKNRLNKMYQNGNSMHSIKEAMNAEFFSERLDCSLSRVHQMFRMYPPLRLQSVYKTDLLLDTLFKKLSFPDSKVFQVPKILAIHHEAVEHFVSTVPDILGIKISYIINQLPLILRRPVESIRAVKSVLEEYNITDVQLKCCLKVINFLPTTLRERLSYLCGSKEFSIFKTHKTFLWLVYNYNNLAPRLEALKANDLPYSISMFNASKSAFEKYICFPEYRSHLNDVCFYLAGTFGCTESEIFLRLKEYPSSQNSSLMNANLVVNFLLDSGVTKKQLFNGLGVIFYNVDIVKLYFQDLTNHPECQPYSEWTGHYNLVQLLIYTIEVDMGFQGSRLYKKSSKMDDLEPLLACSESYY